MTLICERMFSHLWFSGTYEDRSTQFFNHYEGFLANIGTFSFPFVPKKWIHNSHLPQWNAYVKNAFFCAKNCCQYWFDHLHAEYRWHLYTILSEIPQVYLYLSKFPLSFIHFWHLHKILTTYLNCYSLHLKYLCGVVSKFIRLTNFNITFYCSRQLWILTGYIFKIFYCYWKNFN